MIRWYVNTSRTQQPVYACLVETVGLLWVALSSQGPARCSRLPGQSITAKWHAPAWPPASQSFTAASSGAPPRTSPRVHVWTCKVLNVESAVSLRKLGEKTTFVSSFEGFFTNRAITHARYGSNIFKLYVVYLWRKLSHKDHGISRYLSSLLTPRSGPLVLMFGQTCITPHANVTPPSDSHHINSTMVWYDTADLCGGAGWGQEPEGLAKLAAPAQRCFKSVLLPPLAEPGPCSNPPRFTISIV